MQFFFIWHFTTENVIRMPKTYLLEPDLNSLRRRNDINNNLSNPNITLNSASQASICQMTQNIEIIKKNI